MQSPLQSLMQRVFGSALPVRSFSRSAPWDKIVCRSLPCARAWLAPMQRCRELSRKGGKYSREGGARICARGGGKSEKSASLHWGRRRRRARERPVGVRGSARAGARILAQVMQSRKSSALVCIGLCIGASPKPQWGKPHTPNPQTPKHPNHTRSASETSC